LIVLSGRWSTGHAHIDKQTGYLVSGSMTLTLGNEEAELRYGERWSIPARAEHGAQVPEDPVSIAAFQSLRKEYLP
jgi:quercetin dioxygenase-like cupin family protein